MDEPLVKIPSRNPKLYELVQLSQTDVSFDLGDEDFEGQKSLQRGFMRQNSSSFWWDINDDHTDEVFPEIEEDPFKSNISATIYNNSFGSFFSFFKKSVYGMLKDHF